MEKQCENEVWNMRGNIRKFLSLEMAYKRAYRHLLDAQYRFLIDREIIRTDSENGISYDTWAKWLRSRIGYENDYQLFIDKGKELIATIDEIIPQNTKLKFLLSVKNKLGTTYPKQNVLSCVCYYSAMNNLCEFVQLHRLTHDFKIGLYLVKKADKHLGLGVLHYAAIANKLIGLANIDWTTKAVEEVLNLIGRNLFISYPLSRQALRLEHAIPLAEVAYRDYDGEPLQSVSIQLPDNYSFKGRFHLPLSLHGYIATCGCTSRIVIGFRGTDTMTNVITDITQYLIGSSLVYKMALGLLIEIKSQVQNELLVVGHSLGGGLMQFAVAGLNSNDVEGIGFNSAGLSDMTYHLLHGKGGCISHFHLKNDQVFHIGHQLGRCFDMNHFVNNPVTAHRLSTMRKYVDCGCDLPYFWIA
jgi:hypothetical protein